MEKFLYKKLNAFSVGNSPGNPAGCLYLTGDQCLSEAEMLSIAKEHKGFVSEVIYCTSMDGCSYRLRYYSSEGEVEFCGHGTIACMYDLIKSNDKLNSLPEIIISTNKGKLPVYNELRSSDAVFITAPDPKYLKVPVESSDIADHLGILREVINSSYPIELIDAGLRTLIVPIVNLMDTIRIKPDELKLKEFCLRNEIDIILVFTLEVINKNQKARTRVFAPKFGYLEDPATGSGNSSFGYYMFRNGLWNGEIISIEQNGEIDNYNIVKLKTKDNKVLFGGKAALKVEGYYYL
jgi:phenazine biosynthesis protein PhzF family